MSARAGFEPDAHPTHPQTAIIFLKSVSRLIERARWRARSLRIPLVRANRIEPHGCIEERHAISKRFSKGGQAKFERMRSTLRSSTSALAAARYVFQPRSVLRKNAGARSRRHISAFDT